MQHKCADSSVPVSLSKLHILNCQNFNSTPQRTFLSIPLLQALEKWGLTKGNTVK